MASGESSAPSLPTEPPDLIGDPSDSLRHGLSRPPHVRFWPVADVLGEGLGVRFVGRAGRLSVIGGVTFADVGPVAFSVEATHVIFSLTADALGERPEVRFVASTDRRPMPRRGHT